MRREGHCVCCSPTCSGKPESCRCHWYSAPEYQGKIEVELTTVPSKLKRCPICGTWRPRLQKDHIVPRFKGGTNDPTNIQHICANCHEDKTAEERKDITWRSRIGASQTGRHHSVETKRKIGKASKIQTSGRQRSRESLLKQSLAMKGTKQSPEQIAKRVSSTWRDKFKKIPSP